MYPIHVNTFMTQSQNPGVGGRGKLAPYNTTHIRIPEALKPTVEVMANSYKEFISEYYDGFDPELIAAAKNAIAPNTTEQHLVLNEEYRQLLDRILRQSLRLKANADETTKEQIREILALINLE